MASIYDLKPRFQALLRPLSNALAGIGVTANHVTLAAIVLALTTGAAVAYTPGDKVLYLLVPVILFVRMALNAIDGMMAREHDMKSALGAVLNELGDVAADAAMYLPLAVIPGVEPLWVIVFVLLGVISEMAGVVGVQIGASRRYDGPMGKSDRAFVVGAVFLLLGLGLGSGVWIDVVMIACCVLLAITINNRCRGALDEIKE